MTSLLTMAALAAAVTAQPTPAANPLLGAWDWKPVQGQCPEVHTYNADGTAQSQSGSEVLQKTYTATRLEDGMWKVDETVTAGNGGKDCTGSPTPVGATSTVYIQPLNGGGYFTCASQDGMSCYGSASRRK